MNNNSSSSSAIAPPALSPLRIIMNLQQRVKDITYHAGKVYLTALNALFMARRVSSKTMAYTRVTTELRKFSRQMDDRMHALSGKCSGMTYKVANSSKVMKQKGKMRLALKMIKTSDSKIVANLRHFYKYDTDSIASMFTEMREIIRIELVRINDLTRIGQNLVVLSKVEAMQAEDYTDVLVEISARIESSLEEIDTIVKGMQQKIAA